MTKLKTLKDFKFELKEPHAGWLLWYHEVRKEAIKWIKAFDDLENNPDLKKYHGDEEECWIVHFFNITKEDLK